MADITGALHHEFGGKTYCLRMTMRGIAKMQALHGNDLGGLLRESEEGAPAGVPPLAPALDLISIALQRGENMAQEEADVLADDMMTAERALSSRVLAAAFPDVKATPGNGKALAAKRGTR